LPSIAGVSGDGQPIQNMLRHISSDRR